MYELLVSIQFFGILILIIELGYVFHQQSTRQQSLIYLFIFCTIINNFGYFLELTSTTKDTALMAVKLTYLGKVYILLCIFIFLLQYCEIGYNRILESILFGFHSFVALNVLLCDKLDWFYKTINFTNTGLFPHLVITPGILYYVYSIVTFIYLIFTMGALIYRYKHTQNKSKKRQLIYFQAIIAISALSFSLYLIEFSYGYDITALGYVISSFLLLFAIFRHNLFDTLDLAKNQVIENMENGIIVLNESDHIIYWNPPAQKLFPQLTSIKKNRDLKKIFRSVNEDGLLFIEDEVYECSTQYIYAKNTMHGKMILIDNITTSYNYTKELEIAVNEKTQKLERTQHAVIESFANMIEARDGVTGAHVKRTSAYVQITTNALRERGHYVDILTESYSKALINGAPLHDIGKISIPDSILQKPGKLSDEEFNTIKQHAALGAEIIDQLINDVGEEDYLLIARDTARYHHEKWNGTGYPDGLSKDEIPLCARIMAIADVYDALTSNRSYKDKFSNERAISIIKEGSGTHFDPIITATFLDVINQIEHVSREHQ